MPAALLSPCRIKKKRRRVRWCASGRTVYAYVGGNPVQWVDRLGLQAVPMPMPMPAPVPGYVPYNPDGSGTYERPGDIYIYPDRIAQSIVLQGINVLMHPLSPVRPWIQLAAKPDREQRPDNCPTGTKPIDKYPGLSTGDIHGIKAGVNAGPKDWVGISPDGNVWINEGGEGSDQGPLSDYLP